jgi:membrane-associated phospholipid phosphatase
LRAGCAPVALSLGLALGAAPAFADVATERRRGDTLSFALPAVVLAVEVVRGDGDGAWQLTQTFALTTGGTEVLKRITQVRRPDGDDQLSFPSGHAARAFSAAAYVHRRHGLDAAWPAIVLATYVGHTRVIADRHRWADVAGAAALSYAVAHWRVEPTGAQLSVTRRGDGWHVGLAWPLR